MVNSLPGTRKTRLGVCGFASLATAVDGRLGRRRMMMPWGLATYIVDMVWAVLAGWLSTCLVVANEIARAMRGGEIGPFIVG